MRRTSKVQVIHPIWAYFLLYPAGHFGAAPLTTILDFPLVQVIDFATDLFAEDIATTGAGVVAGAGTTTGASFS